MEKMARSVNGPCRKVFSNNLVGSDHRADRNISLSVSPQSIQVKGGWGKEQKREFRI
jgi:hypothetical protein